MITIISSSDTTQIGFIIFVTKYYKIYVEYVLWIIAVIFKLDKYDIGCIDSETNEFERRNRTYAHTYQNVYMLPRYSSTNHNVFIISLMNDSDWKTKLCL